MKIPKHVIQRVSGRAVNATRTDTVTGNHAFTMDEPVARHGNDEGMLPLQALMCSLAGCTNVVANWIAQDLGIEIRDMSISGNGGSTRSTPVMLRVSSLPAISNDISRISIPRSSKARVSSRTLMPCSCIM